MSFPLLRAVCSLLVVICAAAPGSAAVVTRSTSSNSVHAAWSAPSPQWKAGSLKTIYAFQGAPDGAFPAASLIGVNGTLYGTTGGGGQPPTIGNGCSNYGCGTVFEVSSSGAERILYRFQGGTDGAQPEAPLLYNDGILYGTTIKGGPNGAGVVFAVDPSGHERVLYAFKGGADGAGPFGGLITVDGMLYGTTVGGGYITPGSGSACHSGCGTVFKVSKLGVESQIYAFKGDYDGAFPWAGLIDVGGTLYGTTSFAGGSIGGQNYGFGTVFAVSPSGNERVVHKFQSGTDGGGSLNGLINVGGTLYGTGRGNNLISGTVFSLTTTGTEHVLYRFKVGELGGPSSSLLYSGGQLFGTTSWFNAPCTGSACGAIYAVSLSGAARVLYTFNQATTSPGFLALNGLFYGVTAPANAGEPGYGDVFALKP